MDARATDSVCSLSHRTRVYPSSVGEGAQRDLGEIRSLSSAAAERAFDGLERSLGLGAVGTAGLRHVRTSASLATHLLGNVIHQFARLDLGRQVIWNIGAMATLGESSVAKAQVMWGNTLVGRDTPWGIPADVDFATAYLLVSREIGPGKLTLRGDWFEPAAPAPDEVPADAHQ